MPIFRLNTIFRLVIFAIPNIISFVLREFINRKRVTIIVYHDIDVSCFDSHINILKKHYNIISLQRYIHYKKGLVQSLPNKSLIITFDDGYKSNYNLLPVLKKHNISITIFLVANVTNSDEKLWSQHELAKDNFYNLLKMSPTERNEWIQKHDSGMSKQQIDRIFLNIEEINEMKTMVDFQSHSLSHQNLATCSTDEIYYELSESKIILEHILKKPVNCICYPFSLYNEEVVSSAIKAGYEFGFAVEEKSNTKKTNNYCINRISVNASKIYFLLIRVSGLYYFVKTSIFRKHSIFYILNDTYKSTRI